jgi:pimeloyl-ACP methyl ester carboxylesterase
MSSSDPSHPEEGTPRASNGTDDRIPLILIHGAWLSARSWERFADFFGARGYAVSAPEWPRKHGDVEELREHADELAGRGLDEIVDHYARWSTSCVSRPS